MNRPVSSILRTVILPAVLTTLVIPIIVSFAQTSAPAPVKSVPPKLDADECAVWQRELNFALSVDRHDAKAFATFVHPGAVFSAGTDTPTRGRDAIVADWAPIVDGKSIRVRWRPDIVNIGGDRNTAISTGPFVLEDTGPNGKPRYRIGRFNSIWTRTSPGSEWLVLFDSGGTTPSEVPDAKAASDFLSKVPASCPR
jgi:ketosteroid isomerase-like protein